MQFMKQGLKVEKISRKNWRVILLYTLCLISSTSSLRLQWYHNPVSKVVAKDECLPVILQQVIAAWLVISTHQAGPRLSSLSLLLSSLETPKKIIDFCIPVPNAESKRSLTVKSLVHASGPYLRKDRKWVSNLCHNLLGQRLLPLLFLAEHSPTHLQYRFESLFAFPRVLGKSNDRCFLHGILHLLPAPAYSCNLRVLDKLCLCCRA